MSTNKFTSKAHKHTNKITLILTYVLLEWTLIILLLLNSIFSYFIIKFAQFFNLNPPCSWCVRLDRFFEPKNHDSFQNLLCERHSKEVSKLGFCSKHKKLADLCSMCHDCSSFLRTSKNVDFVKRNEELDDLGSKCSCCGVAFEMNLGKNGNLIVDMIGSDRLSEEYGVHIQGKQSKDFEIELIEKDLIQFEKKGELNCDTSIQDLEFCLDYSGNQLVPIESIEPHTDDLQVDEDQEFGDFQKADSVLHDAAKPDESAKFAELNSMEFEETANSLVFHANFSGFHDEKHVGFDTKEEQETGESDSDRDEAEVSIGTEIPVLDSCDEMQAQDNFNLYSLSHEEASSSSHDLDFNLEYGFQEDEETEELKNLNQQNESFDGSEMEGGDVIDTNEKLKSALRDEREALQALCIELEEERSASAVAASETMAMINRLQEEKAAMQMEALHYQRMMEEQSEYDQEALQLLNELMVKKDKELELYRKKVLEMELELELLRSNVKSGTCSASCSHSDDGDGMWVDLNHEPKEEGIRDGNQESQNQNTRVDTILNLDASFVDFEDERLSILEQLKILEEKLCILSDEEDRHFADLKQIEDYYEESGKLLNGNYGCDGQQVNGITRYQDRRPIGSTGKRLLPLFNALETESDDGVITSNGNGNGFHFEKVENNAIESDDGMVASKENGNGFHSDKVEHNAITRFELQKKRIDIEEEVDQLYVRLQALEADREFLKHCIGSLKKGDKGMELLQEILQHLRDLKNMDLREKGFSDGTLV